MVRCPCGGEVAAGGKAPAGGGECLVCGRVFASGEAAVAAGGSAAHVCIRGRRRSALCEEPGCKNEQVALCDEPVEGRRTCDRRVCAIHRHRVGSNRDRCPAHARGAR